MPVVTITDRAGLSRAVPFTDGDSLMVAARAAGVDDILAICGGCASCATCHVYIDPAWLTHLAPPGDVEIDLLQDLEFYRQNSRLSCQIRLYPELAGLKAEIAPED